MLSLTGPMPRPTALQAPTLGSGSLRKASLGIEAVSNVTQQGREIAKMAIDLGSAFIIWVKVALEAGTTHPGAAQLADLG